MKKVIYTGVFVNAEELAKQLQESGLNRVAHEKEIEDTHVTFEFRPKVVDESLFGTPVDILVTGYGSDDENEGLSVRIMCQNQQVQEIGSSVEIPHITLSISRDGRAVNTRRLVFHPIETPFVIKGVYKAFCG